MNKSNILERVRPESVGIAPEALTAFIDSVYDNKINLHGFMLLRHGKVAAEGYFKPFDEKLLHNIYSVSKSITSAAVGIAIGEGLMKLEDRIVDFFPEKVKGDVHPYTKMMTVEHLLMMASVHPKSTDNKVDNWIEVFLNTPPTKIPGTIFAYDTTGTNTLCAIVQKLAGTTLKEYLKPRLFDPIGMGEIIWESSPKGVNNGGGGIKATVEDMARFGQLYLQKGFWNGKRIIPEGWVETSTRRHIDNSNAKYMIDGKKGYGFKFWMGRNNSYCAFGMGGQFIVVIPDKDVVFVTTANALLHKDGQLPILDSMWKNIYPAINDDEIAGRDAAYVEMKKRLDSLELVRPDGNADSKTAGRVSEKRYHLDVNNFGYDACEFIFEGYSSKLSFFKDDEKLELDFGMNTWKNASEPFLGHISANSGTWVDEKTCIISAQVFDLTQMFMLTCRFEGEFAVIQVVPAGAMNLEEMDCFLNGKVQ